MVDEQDRPAEEEENPLEGGSSAPEETVVERSETEEDELLPPEDLFDAPEAADPEAGEAEKEVPGEPESAEEASFAEDPLFADPTAAVAGPGDDDEMVLGDDPEGDAETGLEETVEADGPVTPDDPAAEEEVEDPSGQAPGGGLPDGFDPFAEESAEGEDEPEAAAADTEALLEDEPGISAAASDPTDTMDDDDLVELSDDLDGDGEDPAEPTLDEDEVIRAPEGDVPGTISAAGFDELQGDEEEDPFDFDLDGISLDEEMDDLYKSAGKPVPEKESRRSTDKAIDDGEDGEDPPASNRLAAVKKAVMKRVRRIDPRTGALAAALLIVPVLAVMVIGLPDVGGDDSGVGVEVPEVRWRHQAGATIPPDEPVVAMTFIRDVRTFIRKYGICQEVIDGLRDYLIARRYYFTDPVRNAGRLAAYLELEAERWRFYRGEGAQVARFIRTLDRRLRARKPEAKRRDWILRRAHRRLRRNDQAFNRQLKRFFQLQSRHRQLLEQEKTLAAEMEAFLESDPDLARFIRVFRVTDEWLWVKAKQDLKGFVFGRDGNLDRYDRDRERLEAYFKRFAGPHRDLKARRTAWREEEDRFNAGGGDWIGGCIDALGGRRGDWVYEEALARLNEVPATAGSDRLDRPVNPTGDRGRISALLFALERTRSRIEKELLVQGLCDEGRYLVKHFDGRIAEELEQGSVLGADLRQALAAFGRGWQAADLAVLCAAMPVPSTPGGQPGYRACLERESRATCEKARQAYLALENDRAAWLAGAGSEVAPMVAFLDGYSFPSRRDTLERVAFPANPYPWLQALATEGGKAGQRRRVLAVLAAWFPREEMIQAAIMLVEGVAKLEDRGDVSQVRDLAVKMVDAFLGDLVTGYRAATGAGPGQGELDRLEAEHRKQLLKVAGWYEALGVKWSDKPAFAGLHSGGAVFPRLFAKRLAEARRGTYGDNRDFIRVKNDLVRFINRFTNARRSEKAIALINLAEWCLERGDHNGHADLVADAMKMQVMAWGTHLDSLRQLGRVGESLVKKADRGSPELLQRARAKLAEVLLNQGLIEDPAERDRLVAEVSFWIAESYRKEALLRQGD